MENIIDKKELSKMKKMDYLTWFMHQNVTKKQREVWLKGAF